MKSLVPSLLMIISLASVGGCSGEEGSRETVSGEEGSRQTVFLLKFATHPALDATEQGVRDVLDHSKVDLETFNATGDPAKASDFAALAARGDVDLVIAIATPAAQALLNTNISAPIVYGAVADPLGAGLRPPRATGISNVSPAIIEKAVSIIVEWFPKYEEVGTLYNPGEQNSVYVQGLMKKAFEARGVDLIQRQVSDPAMVGSITEDLTKVTDLIYSANDNTVNSALASIEGITLNTKTPFFIGDLSSLKEGPIAAIGLDYYEHGRQVGQMANDVLQGTLIEDIEPREDQDVQVWVNEKTLRYLGVTVPEGLQNKIDKRIGVEDV